MEHPQAARTAPSSAFADDASRFSQRARARGCGSSACPTLRRQARSRSPQPLAGGNASGPAKPAPRHFSLRTFSASRLRCCSLEQLI
jgi:hypothetical protein